MSDVPLQKPSLADTLLNWADRHRVWLYVLMALAYVAGFNGQWRIDPDSALYLSIGRSLAEGEGFTYHGQTNQLAYPALPWLIAGAFAITGTTTQMWPVLVLMLLLAGVALLLVNRLFWLHGGGSLEGRKLATIVTLGTGAMALFCRYPFQVRNDLLFLVAVLAVLCGWEARRQIDHGRQGRWHDWAMLVGGIAIALITRPFIYVLLAALGLAALTDAIRHKRWRTLLIGGVVSIAGVALLLLIDPRRSAGMDQYERFIFEQLLGEGLWQRVADNFVDLRAEATVAIFGIELGPYLNGLGSLFVLGLGVLLVTRRALWGLWVAAHLPVMLIAEEPKERYFLPILPLLAFAWWNFIATLNRRFSTGGTTQARIATGVFLTLFIIGMAPNMIRTGAYLLEQRMLPFYDWYQEGKWASVRNMAKHIRRELPEDVVIIAPRKRSRVYTYLGNRLVIGLHELPTMRERLMSAEAVYVLGPLDDKIRAALESTALKPGNEVHRVSKNGIDVVLLKATRK